MYGWLEPEYLEFRPGLSSLPFRYISSPKQWIPVSYSRDLFADPRTYTRMVIWEECPATCVLLMAVVSRRGVLSIQQTSLLRATHIEWNKFKSQLDHAPAQSRNEKLSSLNTSAGLLSFSP